MQFALGAALKGLDSWLLRKREGGCQRYNLCYVFGWSLWQEFVARRLAPSLPGPDVQWADTFSTPHGEAARFPAPRALSALGAAAWAALGR